MKLFAEWKLGGAERSDAARSFVSENETCCAALCHRSCAATSILPGGSWLAGHVHRICDFGSIRPLSSHSGELAAARAIDPSIV
jgi:hypothetical protein